MSAPEADPPVVLVPGLATSVARTWGETGWLDLLADAGRETHGIDLPGHGGRPGLADDAAYARLDEIIEGDLPPGPLDGVGFSAGAGILLRIEAAKPGRFRRLVLGGIGESVLRSDDHLAFADAVAAAEGDPEGNPVARHFVDLARSSGTDVDAVVAILRHSRTGPGLTPDLLAGVAASVLVVVGDRDPAGPGEPLAEVTAGARVVTLRGVDHFATPKAMGFLDAGLDHLGAGFG